GRAEVLAHFVELDANRLLRSAVLEREVLLEVLEPLLRRDDLPVLARIDVDAHGRRLPERVRQLLLDLLRAGLSNELDRRARLRERQRDLAFDDAELDDPEVVHLTLGDVDRLLELLEALARIEAKLVRSDCELVEVDREHPLVGAVDEDLRVRLTAR